MTKLRKSLSVVALLTLRAVAGSPPPAPSLVETGRHLYLFNCAHCHADDASGDEGPDLHGLKRSDARIASLILNGIKGEMPRFNQKLSEADVKALTAFLRELKQERSR